MDSQRTLPWEVAATLIEGECQMSRGRGHIACPVPGVKKGLGVGEEDWFCSFRASDWGQGGEEGKGGSGWAEGQRDGTAEVSESQFIKAKVQAREGSGFP